MEKVIFMSILIWAVWQDLKYRSLGFGFLLLAGGAGSLLRIHMGGGWDAAFMSSLVGIMILGLSFLTGGGIGEGDGWFFVITGLFLRPEENIILFLSGLIFCCIHSLTLTAVVFVGGGNIRRMRLPFLPYLLPVGVWLALF